MEPEARAAEMQEEVEEWQLPYGMMPPPQPPPQQAAPPPVHPWARPSMGTTKGTPRARAAAVERGPAVLRPVRTRACGKCMARPACVGGTKALTTQITDRVCSSVIGLRVGQHDHTGWGMGDMGHE